MKEKLTEVKDITLNFIDDNRVAVAIGAAVGAVAVVGTAALAFHRRRKKMTIDDLLKILPTYCVIPEYTEFEEEYSDDDVPEDRKLRRFRVYNLKDNTEKTIDWNV